MFPNYPVKAAQYIEGKIDKYANSKGDIDELRLKQYEIESGLNFAFQIGLINQQQVQAYSAKLRAAESKQTYMREKEIQESEQLSFEAMIKDAERFYSEGESRASEREKNSVERREK